MRWTNIPDRQAVAVAAGLLLLAGGATASAVAADDHMRTSFDIPLTSTSTAPQQAGQAASSTRNASRSTTARFRTPSAPRLGGILPEAASTAGALPPLEAPKSAETPASNTGSANTQTPPLEPPGSTRTPIPSNSELPQNAAQPVPASDPFGSVRRSTIPLEVLPDEPQPEDAAGSQLPAPLQVRRRPAETPVESDEPENDVDVPRSPQRPRRGLLGRVRRRDETIPPAPQPRSMRDDNDDEADADTALQQRLEREITRLAGRHLRGLDVVVKGRKIRIRADVDRLWNRRGVKRAIADLPLLAGYDAVIVAD